METVGNLETHRANRQVPLFLGAKDIDAATLQTKWPGEHFRGFRV